MTKLRTLKDLDKETSMSGKDVPYILEIDLKQEAIKWIRSYVKNSIDDKHGNPLNKNSECKNTNGCGDAGFCVDHSSDVIHFIKTFFNINVEDLK